MLLTGTGNANRINGIPIQPGIPPDTYELAYNATSLRWEFVASGSPSGGSVGGGAAVAAGQVLYGVSAGVAGSNSLFKYSTATGNLSVGTTTDDGVNKLQVAGSATSYGGTDYDSRATIGVTTRVVRAGAGQGSTNLTAWQNNAGAVIAGISNDGNVGTTNQLAIWSGALFGGTQNVGVNNVGIDLGTSTSIKFSSTANSFGTKDLSLSRASPGVIQAGDGGANANGVFLASLFRSPLTTPASASATGVTGTIEWDANYIYIATGTNTWKRVAIATW